METNAVKVKLWGMDVGYLLWDKKMGVAVFEYEPSFLEQELDIAPLTMPVNSPRSQKQLPWTGNKEKLYQGLPAMIADSLPDKWGNSLFKAWLRDNNIPVKKTSPIDHLSFIGSRAMGALEYEPARKLGDNSAFSVDVQRLYEFAKQVLDERETTILNQENSILWQDLVKISSSPGGKRPKAIVALNDVTGEVISGQGIIPEGFQHYILKYDDNSVYPLAKLEYVYYRMALDAGIDMMPSELRTYGNRTHFLTQRFDRIDNAKIHTQTLAAMSPTSDSYEELFAVIRRLNLPYEDSRQQYLRMVFNIIARNVDDHSKNFSFCMNRSGVWRLSPAYDLTYSVDLTAPAYLNRHSLTVNGKNEDITREDLETVGQKNDIQDYKALIDIVAGAIDNFEIHAKELGLDKELITTIHADFIKLH
ncbi:type II toxin-antitoxin system HipA family toxin [Bacteroides reticulotermitis]|uniref:HipA protein n=2 Tax=Bacteroides reticulotermitis TaxID=1133319 RepID=W4UU92_9BACE|nr:type II toxin-antitoxin system HipA family toxin [Bacteroides reticulotermitis]MBB4045629.1 serine/threonine-protein kinase HipA [Bacteroides reticulotermitis]GAE84392.1 HipA protein [Bacteroides reticulotermitis JCM 10512]